MMFVPCQECTWYGDGGVVPNENKRGHTCLVCGTMSSEDYAKMRKSKKKDPTISSKKYRTQYVRLVREFVKVGGEYHTKLKGLLFHAFH